MTPMQLEVRWETYRNGMYEPNLPEDQENELKLTFFAGMIDMFGYMTQDMPHDEKEAFEALDTIRSTLKNATDKVLAKEAARRAKETG